MAMDLNYCVLIGRLVRDPELAYTPNGDAVCKFSIAVNGYKEDAVSFFDIVAWNKSAEAIAKYMSKGKKICVEGNLRQERWEKDGKKYNAVKIYSNRFYFLDSKGSGGNSSNSQNQNFNNNNNFEGGGNFNDDNFSQPNNFDDNIPY